MAAYKLTKTFVDSLPAMATSGEQKLYYDSELKGFGLRVGSKSNSQLLKYRNKYNIDILILF